VCVGACAPLRQSNNSHVILISDNFILLFFSNVLLNVIPQDDWRARRAALLIISIIVEGANEELYEQLIVIVPMVLTRITDPHPRVRCVPFLAYIFFDFFVFHIS
jgi:hypothetical protein